MLLFSRFFKSFFSKYLSINSFTIFSVFHFLLVHNVGDFSVKKMTEQSSFLSGLNAEKQFADRMEKSLRSNKVLQRVLENPETRGAFVNAISAILDDLKNNEKSNSTNE